MGRLRIDNESGQFIHLRNTITHWVIAHAQLLIFVICFNSCIDRITFEDEADQSFLVVDGFIANGSGPYNIRLARSASFASALEEGFEWPVSGAQVFITDEFDTRIDLNESSEGIYSTPLFFNGVIGRSYVLHINIGSNQYISSLQTIPEGASVDSVYWAVQPFNKLSNTNRVLDGYAVQFFADINFNKEDYYARWDWEATYQYCAPRHPHICYIDDFPKDEVHTISSTQGFKSEIRGLPVSLKELNYKFQRIYAYNLRIVNMQADVFTIWQLAERQLQGVGSIFDPVPAQVVSNIRNINDDSEIVLGYFGAFSIDERRVYVRRGEISEIFEDTPVPCPDDVPEGQLDPRCVDCETIVGSSRQAPPWWNG